MASFYKKYIPYLLLTLLFFSLTYILKNIQFKERKTTFSQKFKEIYKDTPTVEIAGFNEAEQWQGNFTLDSLRSFDGATGMNLSSENQIQKKVTLQKQMNLSGYENIYVYVYAQSKEMIDNIEEFSVGFSLKDKSETMAPITGFHEGWNLVTIPMKLFKPPPSNFKEIDSVFLLLSSKKRVSTQISMDRLWTQKDVKNINIFSEFKPQFLNLKTIGKSTYLQTSSPEITNVVLNKEVKNDFSYVVGFAPEKYGVFGMSFQTDKTNKNGYYFEASGQQMDSWRLYKREEGKETMLASGSFKNNVFEKGAYLWLMAEKKGDKIDISFSINSQLFTPIIQTKDNSFKKGFVGIYSKGSYLIDSLEVKE